MAVAIAKKWVGADEGDVATAPATGSTAGPAAGREDAKTRRHET
jgi:hypothetical protein